MDEWMREVQEALEAGWDAEAEHSLTITAGADAAKYASLEMPQSMRPTWGIDVEAWIAEGPKELPRAKPSSHNMFASVCPKCEKENKLVPSDLRLLQYPTGYAYSFMCQHCLTTAVRPADGRVVQLLTDAGVEISEGGEL